MRVLVEMNEGENSPEVLENHAEMTSILERPLESNEMLLVVRIGCSKLVEDLNLLDSSLVPERVERRGER